MITDCAAAELFLPMRRASLQLRGCKVVIFMGSTVQVLWRPGYLALRLGAS